MRKEAFQRCWIEQALSSYEHNGAKSDETSIAQVLDDNRMNVSVFVHACARMYVACSIITF